MIIAHFVNPYGFKFACCPWMGVRPMLNIDTAHTAAPSRSVPGLFLV